MNNRPTFLLLPKNIYRLRIDRSVAHQRLRRHHLSLKAILQYRFDFSQVVGSPSICFICLFDWSQIVRPFGHFQLFFALLQIHGQGALLTPLLLELCPQFLVGFQQLSDSANALDDAIGVFVGCGPFQLLLPFHRFEHLYLHQGDLEFFT